MDDNLYLINNYNYEYFMMSTNLINEAYDKYIVTKIAKDVKEKIFDDALVLEEKWINTIEELKEKALVHVTNQITEHHNEILDFEEKELKRKLLKYEEQANQKFEANVKKRSADLEKRINAIRKEYDDRLEKFKVSEKLRLVNTKKAMSSNHSNEKKAINQTFKDENAKLTKTLANKKLIVTEEEKQNYKFNKEKD